MLERARSRILSPLAAGRASLPEVRRVIVRLDIEAAVRAIRAAFDPFVCVVEIYDDKKRVRFRVFNRDGRPLLSVPRLLASEVVEPATLRHEMQEARARLERQGHTLRPWSRGW